MPYKDPEAKKKWEQQHRSQRLARRRELRQIEAAWKEAHPEVQDSGPGFLLPLAAGSVLAVYNPKPAMGAGGLTLLLAAVYKKDWSWWIVGVLILVIGLFFPVEPKDRKGMRFVFWTENKMKGRELQFHGSGGMERPRAYFSSSSTSF